MNPVGGGALDESEAAGQGVGNEVHCRREAAQREGGEQQQKGPFPEQGLQAVGQGTVVGRVGGFSGGDLKQRTTNRGSAATPR